MVSNEIYTGAGVSATLIPEMDLKISDDYGGTDKLCVTSNSQKTIDLDGSPLLEVNLYRGCFAKLENYTSTTDTVSSTQTLLIESNTADKITFAHALSTDSTDKFKITILGFGAPIYAKPISTDPSRHALLSDNWLGLVETFTPPTITPQVKQLNLALGGTRNFGFQFHGSEDVGEASIDVSLNNGSWLYYTLGKMSYTTTNLDSTKKLSDTLGASHNGFGFAKSGESIIYRVEDGQIYPAVNGAIHDKDEFKKITGDITYTFTENDSGDLPSFALEVTNEKGNVSDADYYQDSSREKLMSYVYTGCQVNTLTLNFEEGQEVKASVSAQARKAHRTENNYTPKRKVRTVSSLFNYPSDVNDNTPYMYSDGTLKMYGQTLGRVKSGSVTIANTLTPHKYIGNYDRTITTAHTAGQRTYEIQLTLMITDRTIWDELRKQTEVDSTLGLIEIEFAKSDTDKITLKFDNYITTAVDVPFPTDKGPLEVSVTAQARSLNTCEYRGKWIIQG